MKKAIDNEISGAGEEKNLHGQTPRAGLVEPKRITVIERLVKNGNSQDQLNEVWLVFVEGPQDGDGYRIVASLDGRVLWLASKGFPKDQHSVVCGSFGDFISAFRGM